MPSFHGVVQPRTKDHHENPSVSMPEPHFLRVVTPKFLSKLPPAHRVGAAALLRKRDQAGKPLAKIPREGQPIASRNHGHKPTPRPPSVSRTDRAQNSGPFKFPHSSAQRPALARFWL